MSSVTLESLRSDLESARYDFAVRMNRNSNEPKSQVPDVGIMEMPLADVVKGFGDAESRGPGYMPFGRREAVQRMVRCAELCEIAESFQDEREGLQAAMLYKLSDGAIDPRKP